MWELIGDEDCLQKKGFSPDTGVTFHMPTMAAHSCLTIRVLPWVMCTQITDLAKELGISECAAIGSMMWRGRVGRVSANSLILQQFQRNCYTITVNDPGRKSLNQKWLVLKSYCAPGRKEYENISMPWIEIITLYYVHHIQYNIFFFNIAQYKYYTRGVN